ncbi:MAG: ABC transporter ATP-binding protein [Rhodobacteraceae bacterium]|nr:ABC transporter ATP-binding protein [Paracoccaceae bacterium]
MPLLEITNLEAFYGRAQSLHGVSLAVEAGTISAIIGPNGAGKSTLLDSILGLVSIKGDIRFDGAGITGLKPAERVRAGIGYAPERGHLFPYMDVRENLLAGATTAPSAAERNLRTVFELFPVLRQRQSQETGTQSGGERQMVSLGRAIMTDPRLLIVDEPTIGLSPKVCLDIATALRRMNEEFGLTILIAEQNVNFAMRLATSVSVLETGEIRMSGTTEELSGDRHVKDAYFGR